MSLLVRRSLGLRLKAIRLEAGKTHNDLLRIGSRSKIIRMEGGTTPVRAVDVQAWCWACGVDPVTTTTLMEMADNTASSGWWEDFSAVLPSWFSTYVQLEQDAVGLKLLCMTALHGLLQTEPYARAVFASEPDLDQEDLNARLSARLMRQRVVFGREQAMRIDAVIDEGLLKRLVGGKTVLKGQVEHLIELSRAQVVDLRVLTWQAGAHLGMRGDFAVLEFDDVENPAMVYLETDAGARYIEQSTTLTTYGAIFSDVRARATPIEEYFQ